MSKFEELSTMEKRFFTVIRTTTGLGIFDCIKLAKILAEETVNYKNHKQIK